MYLSVMIRVMTDAAWCFAGCHLSTASEVPAASGGYDVAVLDESCTV